MACGSSRPKPGNEGKPGILDGIRPAHCRNDSLVHLRKRDEQPVQDVDLLLRFLEIEFLSIPPDHLDPWVDEVAEEGVEVQDFGRPPRSPGPEAGFLSAVYCRGYSE